MGSKQLEPKIFACTQSQVLALDIANYYGVKLGNVNITKFSDGEMFWS